MMNLKQIVATYGDLMFVLRPENGAWPEDHLEVLDAYMEIVLVTTTYTRDFVSDSVYPLLDHLASMQAHCVTDILCYAYPMDYILVKANHFSQQELYDFLFGEGDENPAIMYL